MKNGRVYLRPDALAEPLVNQWLAWPYLIPPATGAMYLANLHVKIMQSFIAAPQTHVAALKNPAMVGGPFMNYDASRVGEVKELLNKTMTSRARLLELAEKIKEVDTLLASEATGFSLQGLYPRIPEGLRGYIELVYDLNNHPSIRFVEGLLYASPYYDVSSQSVALSLVRGDGRPLVFSTPRLPGRDVSHLNLPFESEKLDELFKMKSASQPFEYIRDILEIDRQDDENFASLFTEQEPRPFSKYAGEAVRARYFGHACILIETNRVSILSDPLISYEYQSDLPRYSYHDLPETIDYVVITHNHQDHCLFETLLQLRHRIRNIIIPRSASGTLADPSLKLILRKTGFTNIHEIEEMETVEIPDGAITSLPFFGEHADLNIRTKSAHLIRLKGKTILCAADSNNIEPRLYDHVHEMIGDVNVIFLGMECVGGPLTWLYGPLLTKPISRNNDQSRRFDGSDFEKAIGIVDRLNPEQVYVYAMGMEPWLTFLTSINYTEQSRQIVESDKLVEACRGRGIVSERLFGQKEIILEI